MIVLKRVGIACVFQLFFLCHLQAENYTFNYTAGCIDAIKLIHKLKLEKAKTILFDEHKKQPNNIAIDYLESCAEYYELVTTGDKAAFSVAKKNKNKILSQLQKIADKQPNAAYANAEIVLHWSVLELMHNEYINGALELRNAYQLHNQNLLKYPTFYPTQKSLGFIKAILGTLPENYNWILNIVGLKGNYAEGIKLIEQYLAQKTVPDEQLLDKQQADFYFALLQLYFGDKQTAWNYTNKHTENYSENIMSCYLRALIASRTAHTDECISVIYKKPKSTEINKFTEMDFLLGYAKLNKLDKDADIEFKKIVTFSKNKHQQKESYKRLAWSALIQHDSLRYSVYRNLAFRISTYKDDEDKWVTKDIENNHIPNATILKARLQFDGGYYFLAETTLKEVDIIQLPTKYQLAEYYYRFGRIMQEQKKYTKAIEYFTEAIKKSEPNNIYFAPFSTLQLGNIYAKLGFNQTALFYFNKTLLYKDYEAKGFINQKTKQALSEIK